MRQVGAAGQALLVVVLLPIVCRSDIGVATARRLVRTVVADVALPMAKVTYTNTAGCESFPWTNQPASKLVVRLRRWALNDLFKCWVSEGCQVSATVNDDIASRRRARAAQEVRAEVGRLLRESKHTKTERRSHDRHLFVYPVTIYQNTRAVRLAFSRDISAGGIGLIQAERVDPGVVSHLEIRATGTPLFVRAQAKWCRSYGSGWYLVGWKFLGLSDLHRVRIPTQRPR